MAGGLSGNQKRLLASSKEHGGNFTSRRYQNLVDIDIYTASRDIKDLISKGLVKLPKKGGRVYEIASSPEARMALEKPPEFSTLEPLLKTNGYIKNEDIRKALSVSRRQAVRVAENLVGQGLLKVSGVGRGRHYLLVG